MTAGDEQAYAWPTPEPKRCSARIDSGRGVVVCDSTAGHPFGHTFTASSQPQDAGHDTEARQEAQG